LTWRLQLWESVWSPEYGPDWVKEQKLALAGLEAWLARILAGGPEGIKAIIEILCLDNWTFNGLGCHTAMDALYVAVVHPAMTCFALCASDIHFTRFKAALLECFDVWSSSKFFARCATNRANMDYPLMYQYASQRNYVSTYIKVHMQETCHTDIRIHNLMVSEGLFDSSHVIGQSNIFCLNRFISPSLQDNHTHATLRTWCMRR
jgi:hypothetical protein